MFQYVLKRLLLFVPTLIAVSMVAFGLSKLAPGDPVLDYLHNDPFATISTPADLLNAEKAYRLGAGILRLDKPAFYFSVTPSAYPDTLHRVVIKDRRETLEKLIGQYGNWEQVESYYRSVRALELKALALPDTLSRQGKVAFKRALGELYVAHKNGTITARLNDLQSALETNPPLATVLGSDFDVLKKQYETLTQEASPTKLLMPAFYWHGLDNQYHTWLANFLQGDFGISVFERRPAAEKVKPALFWTVAINAGAILLAYLLAIPLGVWSAARRGSRFDRGVSLGLFMLYSLPAFWVGTMMLIFFTTREYGMNIFPGPGLGNIPSQAPWWKQLWLASPHLMLPVVCVAYPALAFISRQVRGSMASALAQDYVRTARAKGLPERTVIRKHAFRNSLFPLITMFASVLPGAIAGSVAIEVIFNIPGMGWLTLNAIYQKDWTIVFTVLMLGSGLTMAGMLLADLLYAWVDPRVRFGKK
jgi:peptide/nickel transport system permease protein